MSNLKHKPWLASYPSYIDQDFKLNDSQPLHVYLRRVAESTPHLPAFENFDTTLTYGELESKSRSFAAYLLGNCKLSRQSRIAIMLPNTLQYPVVLFGALRAGLAVVNINPLYTARELKVQLIDSGAEALVVLENFAQEAQKALPETKVKHVFVSKIGDLLSFPKSVLMNFALRYLKRAVPPWEIQNAIKLSETFETNHENHKDVEEIDDIAFLQYTGGTTGNPKGAVLTHRNVSANLQQVKVWGSNLFGENSKEIAITALPLYHIFSLTANCLFITMLGGLNVLVTNPRDVNSFVKIIKKHKFTIITGVDTLYYLLLSNREFAKVDFSSLKFTASAGMAVSSDTAAKWEKLTNSCMVELYGLSETSPAACLNPTDLKTYNGFVGLPAPLTDIKIIDLNGDELGVDEVGELCIKGPQVMTHYWKYESKRDLFFTSDGFLRTGDIARVNNEGFVKIMDRKKDMIIISGFNVYPNEVEDVIMRHPDVIEAAVVGYKEASNRENIRAFVVTNNKELTKKDIIKHCSENLVDYKLPKDVVFKSSLPKSNVGKILRRSLRED